MQIFINLEYNMNNFCKYYVKVAQGILKTNLLRDLLKCYFK